MTNLVFDYDGTIHNCLKIYKPAFLKACQWLKAHGYPVKDSYSDSEIGYWLGFTSTDMWAMFQPELPADQRDCCRHIIGESMAEELKKGNAELFPGAEKALTELKNDGYKLIFLSNCRIRYQQRHTENFGLDRWFDAFYNAEEYGFIPKHEIFRQQVKKDWQGDFIVIGDRFHDIETAVLNGVKSIGCGYGYGSPDELEKADIIICSVTEIPEAGRKLRGNI